MANNVPDKAAEDGFKSELVRYLLDIDTERAMDHALDSLLTPSEYQEIAKRLQIFKLLDEGVAHRKIAETLGVGIATVSRGARAFSSNTHVFKDTP
ncbi:MULTISPECIES: trp operon repressor [unclassified Halomonas]|uniref:trp operon repressor n=1 Tax=unclassified Halomonas TaxID=2609666 RepID=UPI0021E49CEF|nr:MULTISPECIES: trp operon repressor [unclassified Halomonas]UYG01479.1 trp operon repressor [Halomonas sp. GD1P12]WNL37464.1 trp operon repressor [Halomonas sp. PAMB 3232]